VPLVGNRRSIRNQRVELTRRRRRPPASSPPIWLEGPVSRAVAALMCMRRASSSEDEQAPAGDRLRPENCEGGNDDQDQDRYGNRRREVLHV
jgi:hypothetical protein